MDLLVKNDVAVVVGGAQGIGAAIADAAAAEGMCVAVLDIHPSRQAAAEAIAARHQVKTCALAADVTDAKSLDDAAAQVRQQLGACDHLFCAAGAGSGKFGFPFWNLEPTDWPRVLDINLTGAVRTLHAFREQLMQSAHGSALLIASIAGQIGSPTDPPYSAAKAGVINFTQCAARDLAAHGVRVNAISPGMIKTTLNKSVWQAWNDRQPADQQQDYESWGDEKVRRNVPLGRWQTPEDIAAAAVFLASPRAGNITGQTVNVDGGQVMHA
ncbi:MAG: SDR family oxidoreductase [Planctomycetales bacterium]|nr:SDR family oxidoreductase [Planctomycetales bacterium]